MSLDESNVHSCLAVLTCLVHSFSPSLCIPRIFSCCLSRLQITKQPISAYSIHVGWVDTLRVGPHMIHCIQFAQLSKPRAHRFAKLSSALEAFAPRHLPLQQPTWLQYILAKLENAVGYFGRRRLPKVKFKHDAVFTRY